MRHEFKEIDRFFVAGIAVRTTNRDDQAKYDIGELWGKFMVDKLAGQIPEKLSEDLYCVYTDYSGDHTQQYTALLGCKVQSIGGLTGGFVGVEIPGGQFQIFEPEGELPQSMANAWAQIWQSDLDRKYAADFDLYHAPENGAHAGKIEIFVGIK